CLGQIFRSLGQSDRGKEALTNGIHVPQIGKTLSVILDNITATGVQSVAISAITTLGVFCSIWPDEAALSLSFFPGIVSTLTRLLSPKPSDKPWVKVLVAGVQLFSTLLLRVLGDE